MTDPTAAFTKMLPGFDFLQGLVKNAGAAVPGMGQWVTPTLDPEELDKRIQELRTVQFWLEQNARLLATTIQALEVQRMTLSTLKTMNVSLGDLTESLKIRMPEPSAPPATTPAPAPAPEPAPATASTPADASPAAAPHVPPGVADPMQWWGALTKQFTDIATNAMKDGGAEAAQQLAGSMVQQGMAAASKTLQAAGAAAAAAKPEASAPTGAKRAAASSAKPRVGAKAGAKASTRSAAKPARKRSA